MPILSQFNNEGRLMVKKLFLISTLTILAGSIGLRTVPVFARESGEIWTVPQLITLQEEVVAETSRICAGDTFCENELYFDHLRFGGKYAALDGFSNMIILITAINPSSSTIRVIFHDEDPIMRWVPEENRRSTLDELYVSKFSNHPGIDEAHDIMRSGHSGETHHPLFVGAAATNGIGWFASNVEVELPITNATSLLEAPYIIHFAMEADYTNVLGAHDYSDCLTSPAYKEGMECRAVFDENGWFYFLPFWPGAELPATMTATEDPVSEEATSEDTPAEGSTPPDDTPMEGGLGAVEPEEGTTLVTEITPEASSTETTSISDILPTTPDTGKPTYGFHAKKTDLPLWIAGLIVANFVLLVWWFMPVHRKSPKIPKKSKKGIDKKTRVR